MLGRAGWQRPAAGHAGTWSAEAPACPLTCTRCSPTPPSTPVQEKGRIFRESFISKLALLLRGTVAAPPERFGETLADEHIRGGAFVGPDNKPVMVTEHLPNAHMRLFGGAQYHRAMAEFRAGAWRWGTWGLWAGRGGGTGGRWQHCWLGPRHAPLPPGCALSSSPHPYTCRHRHHQLPRHLSRGNCQRLRYRRLPRWCAGARSVSRACAGCSRRQALRQAAACRCGRRQGHGRACCAAMAPAAAPHRRFAPCCPQASTTRARLA